MNEDGGEQFEAENSSPGMTSTPKGRSSIHGSKKGVPTNDKVTPSSRSRSSAQIRGSSSEVCPSTPENSQTGLTPEDTNVSEALKEITSLLNTVVKRIDHMEDKLKQQLSTSTVSSSSATEADKRTKKKRSIPLVVRVSYHFLMDRERVKASERMRRGGGERVVGRRGSMHFHVPAWANVAVDSP